MQGILPEIKEEADKALNKAKTLTNSAVEKSKFWQFKVIGPIAALTVLSVMLSLIGYIISCVGCFPVRLLILCIYAFGLAIVLLYKFVKAQCDSKPIEDVILLAAMPTLIFAITYTVVNLGLSLIPVIGFIPVIPGVVAASVGAITFSAALNHSRPILVNRACDDEDIRNLWTFNK